MSPCNDCSIKCAVVRRRCSSYFTAEKRQMLINANRCGMAGDCWSHPAVTYPVNDLVDCDHPILQGWVGRLLVMLTGRTIHSVDHSTGQCCDIVVLFSELKFRIPGYLECGRIDINDKMAAAWLAVKYIWLCCDLGNTTSSKYDPLLTVL